MIIYLARNKVNGKAYVGKTKRSLDQRAKEHAAAAAKGSPQPLHRAIRKHGMESFTWHELINGECSEDELDLFEQHFIAEHGTYGSGGYNATLGGDGVKGLVHSAETRAKMSESRKGEKNHNFGKDWGRKGPHTEEAKQKMSEAKLGSQHTEETRQKIGKAQYVAIAQYDMDGNFIANFSSMIEAEQKTGVGRTGISRCCRFIHRSAAGFRFRYLNESQKGQ